mmetsp:Transcript_22842/g.32645  ORF Transcript_22842/g.32645 Transcript_22842/m.32645 type:complete len:96 (-) Transcript_22842:16-303(-)
MECQEQQLDDDCNEPPAKKAKPTTFAHSLKCGEDGTIGEDEASQFLSNLEPKVFNTLFAQMMKKKHEESNDSHAFSYQHVKNRKKIQYVRRYSKM